MKFSGWVCALLIAVVVCNGCSKSDSSSSNEKRDFAEDTQAENPRSYFEELLSPEQYAQLKRDPNFEQFLADFEKKNGPELLDGVKVHKFLPTGSSAISSRTGKMPPILITLASSDDEKLSGIRFGFERSRVWKAANASNPSNRDIKNGIHTLHMKIKSYRHLDLSSLDGDPIAEVWIDADDKLHYRYVIDVMMAVSGYTRADGSVQGMITKIGIGKYEPPTSDFEILPTER